MAKFGTVGKVLKRGTFRHFQFWANKSGITAFDQKSFLTKNSFNIFKKHFFKKSLKLEFGTPTSGLRGTN